MGLSALVAASATAFTAVKLAGAAYLLYLGVQTLLSGRRDRPVPPAGGGRCRPERVGLAAALREGLLTNLLNPKVAVFFVAFLPQFVPVGTSPVRSTAVLAAVFVVRTAVYLLVVVTAVSLAAAVLARPAVRRGMDRIAGITLVAFGIRLASAER